MRNLFLLVLILITSAPFLSAQTSDTAGSAMRLYNHVSILASDEFGGRLTGTKYEKKASGYISNYYKEYGLEPLGNNKNYLQAFAFTPAIELGKKNSFKIEKNKYPVNEKWYPVPVSSSGKVEGTVVNETAGISESGSQAGNILLLNLAIPADADPHDPSIGWRSRLDAAAKTEPAAVVLYNAPNDISLDGMRGISNLQPYKFLVVHVGEEIATELQRDESAASSVKISVDLKKPEKTGHNVIGYIDNNASSTIVIGAHYDHLGMGEYGSSLSAATGEIHNGADDNASGTAVLLELAMQVKKASLSNHNYLFLAFSGEELGLLGSNYFTRHLPEELPKMMAMLNMDMVGRLNPQSQELGINGTGTSPVWDSLLNIIRVGNIREKTTSSGMGSSDHTSFYLKEIPAIHFFTGVHSDYHKPSDDVEKLNITGMAAVSQYIFEMILHLEKLDQMEFIKTKNDGSTVPRFKVTLGIMPDYFYDKGGLRVEGVSEGKPASEAGMKDGDIILQMGDVPVRDIMSYMQALSHFSKGDEVEVLVKRKEETRKLKVKF